MLVGFGDAGFHFAADLFVLTHKVDEFSHELIALVFQELVAASRGTQLTLQVGEFHSRRVDVENCHYYAS